MTTLSRRKLIQTAGLLSAAAVGAAMPVLANAATSPAIQGANTVLTQEWDKVFPKSDKVDHQKVTFTNRYGITLAGDLYLPKNRAGKKLPAVAVAGAFGAVKEQISGLYAQKLAEQGFITLAFDGSYTGESSGEPRNMASPEINTEDFSAAVDYLITRNDVDEDRIGILGICGWGGMALNAAAIDTRIKATATSTMYDMTRVMSRGYNDSMTADDRYKMREQLNAQRSQDAKNGTVASIGRNLPEKLAGDEPWFVKEYFDFYRTPRGFHPRSTNSNAVWTATTPLPFINMPLLSYIDEIRNPVLIVHGEKAHSRYFSEDAFKRLTGNNKELLIVPDATHVDLYDDRAGKIPHDKLADFFSKNLK